MRKKSKYVYVQLQVLWKCSAKKKKNPGNFFPKPKLYFAFKVMLKIKTYLIASGASKLLQRLHIKLPIVIDIYILIPHHLHIWKSANLLMSAFKRGFIFQCCQIYVFIFGKVTGVPILDRSKISVRTEKSNRIWGSRIFELEEDQLPKVAT